MLSTRTPRPDQSCSTRQSRAAYRVIRLLRPACSVTRAATCSGSIERLTPRSPCTRPLLEQDRCARTNLTSAHANYRATAVASISDSTALHRSHTVGYVLSSPTWIE